MRDGTVLLETAEFRSPHRSALLFENPLRVLVAYQIEEIITAFEQLEEELRKGFFAAGFVSYEAGYAFEKQFHHKIASRRNTDLPLLWFGIYEEPNRLNGLYETEGEGEPKPILPSLDISEAQYSSAISSIQELIRSGDVYQINFTSKYRFHCARPFSLYNNLRHSQSALFSAYLNCRGFEILSLSPELFFRIDHRLITAKPMKGTAPRAHTAAGDELVKEWLQCDEKNQAENLMILDLLRNDLGRICEIGSIHVPELFQVETMQTVHQMTSTVVGTLAPEITPYKLFWALFPSGSITGAPKVKAMEVIASLETEARGVYCGAIGYFAPNRNPETDHSRKSEQPQSFSKAVFNVAIRTAVCREGEAEYGVGSGITIDSEPLEEFEECKLKAKFLVQEYKAFSLIETMRVDLKALHLQTLAQVTSQKDHHASAHPIALLQFHLQRLKDSAYYFGYYYNEHEIVSSINSLLQKHHPEIAEMPHKLRLLLDKSGENSLELTPLPLEKNSLKRVCFAKTKTNSRDRFFYHKTTNRTLYTNTYATVQAANIWDAIFFNEKDEATETCIGNIFLKNGNEFLTPPVSAGLLNGVFREYFLQNVPACKEMIITKENILKAEKCYVGNSLRGLSEVEVLDETL